MENSIGFANVARWIALDHDNETSIYRRFGELGARNLLYIQCEMLVLEKELHELDKGDFNTDDMHIMDEARTWETFVNRYKSGTDQKTHIRMDLVKQLRCKIKEYRRLSALWPSCPLPNGKQLTGHFRRGATSPSGSREVATPQQACTRHIQTLVLETLPSSRWSRQNCP